MGKEGSSTCGGPTSQQTTAANSTAGVTKGESNLFNQDVAATQPFWTNILQNGIPGFAAQQQYSTSDIGNQIDQAKAGMNTKLAGFGSALPSGFATQEDADLDLGGAQMFDQNQLNLLQQQFAAKQNAAQALNPQNPAQAVIGGNQSIMQAPLQNNFWQNLIGGVIQGGSMAGSAAIKACWIAEVLWGVRDPRTLMLRKWMQESKKHFGWRVFEAVYRSLGPHVAEIARFSPVIRGWLRPLFDLAWNTAAVEV